MSSLEDNETVIELETKMKKGRHEDEDRLSDLPDCILLHIFTYLKTRQAVRTCILSKRWRHLWKRTPVLILTNSLDYYTLDKFDRFVSGVMSLHYRSIALSTFNYDRHGSAEPHILKEVAKYVTSRSAELRRLEITVKVRGDNSSLILPCIASCRALTYLNLSVILKDSKASGCTLFPNSLDLPALTTLDLTDFAFCASDNADCAEPFSAFSSLKNLIIRCCTVKYAQILNISNATLVNLTMYHNCSDFKKIQLSSPSLSSFTLVGSPYQKLCGSTLSYDKQLNIDVRSLMTFWDHHLVLISWLLDLPNITSLAITSSTLKALSKIPDLFKVDFPSFSNLKSLKVDMRFEVDQVQFDRVMGFLLQNSPPSAKVEIIGCCQSLKPMQNDTSLNEDAVKKIQPNTHFPPLDNGP